MATPNYSYEKRQRELAKRKKKEEKSQRKLLKSPAQDTEASESLSEVSTIADADDAVKTT